MFCPQSRKKCKKKKNQNRFLHLSRDICFVGWHQTSMQNLVEPTLHTPGYLEEQHSKQGAREFGGKKDKEYRL